MDRRQFIISALLPLVLADKTFRYRIKTKAGGIVGGTITASDAEAAKVKISKRYPDCQFLSLEEIQSSSSYS